jgi:hypothetical protein
LSVAASTGRIGIETSIFPPLFSVPEFIAERLLRQRPAVPAGDEG